MISKILNSRFLILYAIPFLLGSSTVFSFEPFNFTLINFFYFTIFFYLIVYIKKNLKAYIEKDRIKKNLFIFGTLFGFGFF